MSKSLKEFAQDFWATFIKGFDEEQKLQTFIIEGEDGGISVMITPWGNDKEKFAILTKVVEQMVEVKAKRYALYSEAWTTTYSADTPPEERLMPSESPDRREIVMCTAVDRGGDVHHQSATIHKGADGKRFLGPIIHNDADNKQTGLMTTLFTAAQRLEMLNPQLRALLLASSPAKSVRLDPKTGEPIPDVTRH